MMLKGRFSTQVISCVTPVSDLWKVVKRLHEIQFHSFSSLALARCEWCRLPNECKKKKNCKESVSGPRRRSHRVRCCRQERRVEVVEEVMLSHGHKSVRACANCRKRKKICEWYEMT
ncbi:uncharacterized protein LOC126927574 [Bombus affinis]|uniref:uncharacterized protein LOC126927574 n=1 Tax=Bombus affinis TaxID=309941 RepID=UPI0021B7F27D|nr:uncharacterized protein LOC126927574 [Bombus affinis]